jgi:hypothetical protein
MRRTPIAAVALIVIGLAASSAMAAGKKGKAKFEPALPDPTQTECVLPFRPSVAIDGATATQEQINALAERVKRYQHQLKSYRDCLGPKLKSAQSANNLSRLKELDATYNASVQDEQKVVAGYNAVAAAHERQLSSEEQAAFARCYLDQQEKMDPTKIYNHCIGKIAGSAHG